MAQEPQDVSALSRPAAVTVVTGSPSPLSLLGRSSLSQRDTREGSVERITSSKPWRLTASWIAASGSGAPTIPVTGPPAASSSSGSASSSVALASPSSWSSGSAMRSRPLDVLGTSSVKVLGPRWARSRTAASRAGVAAVRFATTRTRAGWAEDSMRNSFASVKAGRRGVYAAAPPLRELEWPQGRSAAVDAGRREPRAAAQVRERLDHLGVELRARPAGDLLGRGLDAERLFVRALVDEDVEHVGHVDEPPHERDVGAGQ